VTIDVTTAGSVEAPAGPSTSSRADRWRAVAILAVMTAVAAGLGELADALTVPSARPVRLAGASDSFDRPDSDVMLGRAPSGQRWVELSGDWGTEAGLARVVRPAPGVSLAVVPVGSANGRLQLEVGRGAPGLAVVFRCLSPFDCWRVEAVPAYATWNLLKVVGGREVVVGNVGRAGIDPGTTVEVSFTESRIAVSVDGSPPLEVEDDHVQDVARVGLALRGAPGAADARWAAVRFLPDVDGTPLSGARVTTTDFAGADDALGRFGSQRWRTTGEGWSVRGGMATIRDGRDGGRRLALVDAPSSRYVVESHVMVANGTGGLAFRCRDPRNCWMVETSGGGGIWRVRKTVDGSSTRVLSLGRPDSSWVARVRVVVDGDELTFFLNGERVGATVDPALADETGTGLVVQPTRRDLEIVWGDFRMGPWPRP
jgi:hypothetical protein